MRWLIKSAKIIAPGNALNGKKRDLLIENGSITAVKTSITDKDAVLIKAKGLCVSPGWVDARADFRDPGEEYKEGLLNGLDAAANGGFTHVIAMPGTQPPIDHRSKLEYLLHRSKDHVCRLLPTGTISQEGKGQQLAELYDMTHAGAIAFTDDSPVERAELMRRALEYSASFGAVICTLPWDADLVGKGSMHEGFTSMANGLKGIPEMAETIRLMRDIELLRYTNGRLHVMLISTAESVNLVKKAKKEGLQITCGVSANHLLFCDRDLANFDANLKVLPPFRNTKDRDALRKAVTDGTIDVIVSDHRPEDIEHKDREFVRAAFGIGAIEQTFNAALEAGISPETFVERVAVSSREIFNLPPSEIHEGAQADLTLFVPEEQVEVTKTNLQSHAWNNPYVGRTMNGKVLGVIRGDSAVIC